MFLKMVHMNKLQQQSTSCNNNSWVDENNQQYSNSAWKITHNNILNELFMLKNDHRNIS